MPQGGGLGRLRRRRALRKWRAFLKPAGFGVAAIAFLAILLILAPKYFQRQGDSRVGVREPHVVTNNEGNVSIGAIPESAAYGAPASEEENEQQREKKVDAWGQTEEQREEHVQKPAKESKDKRDPGQIPPVVEPVFGSIALNVDPYAATIYVDGEKKGVTPKTLDSVRVGRRELSLHSPTPLSQSWDTTLTVVANQEIKISHEFLYGQLSINAQPFGYVYLDGERMGRTPKTFPTISVGIHTIRVEWADGSDRSLEVHIREKHRTRVLITPKHAEYDTVPAKV